MTEESVDFLGAAVASEGSHEETEQEKFVNLESIAAVGWEALRAWGAVIGEAPWLTWERLTDDAKRECIDNVSYILDHPHSSISMQHDNWRARQAALGRPDVGPFDSLPFSQQVKAKIWRHIVHAIVG